MEITNIALEHFSIDAHKSGNIVYVETPVPFFFGGLAAFFCEMQYAYGTPENYMCSEGYMASVTITDPKISTFLNYFRAVSNDVIFLRYRYYYSTGQNSYVGFTQFSQLYRLVLPEGDGPVVNLSVPDTRTESQQIADYVYFTTHDANFLAEEENERLRNLRERYSE